MSRVIIMAVLSLAITGHAQISRGTVTGTVMDPTGAVVGGAQTKLAEGHALRYAIEFMRQGMTEAPSGATLGKVVF